MYDSQGSKIGVVEHVMADHGIFDGVIVHTYPLPGRHLYAEAEQITEIREHGVVLAVPAVELHDPDQRKRPRRRDTQSSPLESRLRRAWDWIMGSP